MKICHNCGQEWIEDYKPGYSETCDMCGYSLHCCKNCKYYDITRSNNCAEPMAERVGDADGQNFCGYFEFKDTEEKITETTKFSRANFDNLFNKFN